MVIVRLPEYSRFCYWDINGQVTAILNAGQPPMQSLVGATLCAGQPIDGEPMPSIGNGNLTPETPAVAGRRWAERVAAEGRVVGVAAELPEEAAVK